MTTASPSILFIPILALVVGGAVVVATRAVPKTSPHRTGVIITAVIAACFAAFGLIVVLTPYVPASFLDGLVYAVLVGQAGFGALALIDLARRPPDSRILRIWRWSWLTIFTASATGVAVKAFQESDPYLGVQWGFWTSWFLWLASDLEHLVNSRRARAEEKAAERRERRRLWVDFPQREPAGPTLPRDPSRP